MTDIDTVLGRADLQIWQGYQVKGTLLAARPRYVLEQWGEAALQDLTAQLSPATRIVFESPALPFTWHSFHTLAEIDAAIIRGPMGGKPARMKHFGATIARYDLPTLYKMLFKLGTPSFLIKRVGVVYGMYFRGGGIAAPRVDAQSAHLMLAHGVMPLYMCRYGISGWLTAALELSGARGVRVDEVECRHAGAPACTWTASWL